MQVFDVLKRNCFIPLGSAEMIAHQITGDSTHPWPEMFRALDLFYVHEHLDERFLCNILTRIIIIGHTQSDRKNECLVNGDEPCHRLLITILGFSDQILKIVICRFQKLFAFLLLSGQQIGSH